MYHHAAGDKTRLWLYKCVCARRRLVRLLCGAWLLFVAGVGMVDGGGDKNAARLVFCACGGVVFISYILYYILFFLLYAQRKNGVPFGAPSFLIPFPV